MNPNHTWGKYREPIAYIFFGVCTVIVNTLMYYGLAYLFDDMIANTIAFFIAVQFAYMTNTKFVFYQHFTKSNFLKFWSMRIGTLLIDDGGMWLFLQLDFHKLVAKCFVNVIVIILNYIFSKFYIFKKD